MMRTLRLFVVAGVVLLGAAVLAVEAPGKEETPMTAPARGVAIAWWGHACFSVTDADGHTVLVDPYHPATFGQSLQGLRADLVLATHEHGDHFAVGDIAAARAISGIRAMGTGATLTDEATGIAVTLVPATHGPNRGDNCILVWRQAGITLCHLGDLGAPLTPEQVAQIGAIDVLCVPVGGYYTIDAAQARATVAALKPRVVLPMHYKIAGRTEARLPISDLHPFLDPPDAPWSEVRTAGTTITLTPETLPAGTVVVVMEAGKR